MKSSIHSSRPAIAAAIYLSLAATAHAGGGGMGTPTPGTLSSSGLRPAAGQTVTVHLSFQPVRDAGSARVTFRAPPCARIAAAETQQLVRELKAGQTVELDAHVTVLRRASCLISADVVDVDTAALRSGAIFGVVLNQAASSAAGHAVAGQTGAGQRTIDALPQPVRK
ncbi:hypothetical protein [Rugamonas sp.]|uniref:hypothetical protein n=1 Tax=Rugamonas sp. TaxID=1926287 RepID=UPI0025D4F51D|nr:hypothetical protein [Rugamonas sp.]